MLLYKKDRIDLTEGIIWKTLLMFTLPIVAGNFFQHLYTTADAIIIGKFTGKAGLAAIDSVYSLLKLPINIFGGLSAGAAILVSQLFGAKQGNDLFRTIHTALGLTLIIGTALSAIGVLASPFLLRVMGVPDDIFTMTLTYVRIYFAGIAVSLLYNIGAGILRALGNAKTPFYALIVSSLLNVILDLCFIGMLNGRIGGAALATVLAQLLSAVIILCALMQKSGACPVRIANITIQRQAAFHIAKIGIPIGVQSALFPIANMMIQAAINSTGTENIAAWAVCGKLDFLIWIILEAMTSAVAPFAAQNYGAKKYRRVTAGVRVAVSIAVLLIGAMSAVLYFWSIPIGKLFINAQDYTVLAIVQRLMRIQAPFYTVFVFAEILAAAIQGTGETVKPMLLTVLGICLFRIIWIVVFVPFNPVIDIIIAAFPLSWILTSILFVVYYCKYRKRLL